MKRLIIAVVMVCGVALSAQSQEFAPFRVDGGVGYGIPFTDGYDGGVLLYVEPKYAVTDKISVGVRWEGSLFAGAGLEGEKASVKLNSSYMATGDYFFNSNRFRPFAGLGLGAYSMAGASVDASVSGVGSASIEVDGTTSFAALLRAGFDFSHLIVTASYNIAFAEKSFSFLGVTVGFYIGGGRK